MKIYILQEAEAEVINAFTDLEEAKAYVPNLSWIDYADVFTKGRPDQEYYVGYLPNRTPGGSYWNYEIYEVKLLGKISINLDAI